jgi:hypothetical protein
MGCWGLIHASTFHPLKITIIWTRKWYAVYLYRQCILIYLKLIKSQAHVYPSRPGHISPIY